MNRWEFDKKDRQAIIHAYVEGLQSMRSIGEEYGVDQGVIRRILREENVPLRKRGGIAGKKRK